MSLGGGGGSQSTTDTRLNGMSVDQCAYGNAIPLGYGQNRWPMFLLWYGNFVATPHTTSNSGGKGGGGGGGNTTYTYSASMVMGLGEGPITGIGQCWQDKTLTTLATLGYTLFTGLGSQAVWSYLTTNFAAQAVPYDHTAFLATANTQLGSSAALPNLTYEVTGFLPYEPGVINDAEPSAILVDYCTEPNHGAQFYYLSPSIQGPGPLTFQSYCIAMGFFISPLEATQRAANDFLKEILQITNSDSVWSAGLLNIHPYQDTPVSGNGATYTPNLTPIYSFTDDDFMPSTQGSSTAGADPVIVTRKPVSETYNVVRVEFLDRTNAYNTAIAEASDALDIELNGMRVMATLTFHSITTAPVARQCAQLILQRQLYIRNTFVFSVRPDYSLLEPMDLVAITDSTLGIFNKLVRITEVDDDENDILTITAEDMLVGTASAPLYNWQGTQGYAANFGVLPPSVGAPVIFNGPPLLVSHVGGYELWLAVDAGAAGSWGGCDVYMSLDNLSYIYAGTMNGASRYGTLTAALPNHVDFDTADTLSVQLTNPATTELQLVSGSAADYQNLRTLIFVDGEIMAYQTATLTAQATYNLTTLRRGLYGSVAEAHAIGAPFVRIDAGIFRVPFDVGMMGQTMYFKFASFNVYQKSYQSLSACTAYPHVLTNVNAGQLMPGALTLIGVGVTTASNTAFKSAQTAAWDSSVYSAQSYTSGCSIACYASNAAPVNGIMLGFTLNPSASNFYTNLAFALYAGPGGTLQIFEGGVSRGSFGAYTKATLLNIIYDGKHIAYYANGVLLRSVPQKGLTLFLQICLCDAGDAVYGIDFTPTGTAVTPFTLVPLSAGVAAVGTRAQATSLAAVGWGNNNFQSKESYSNGAIASASVGALSGALQIGFSTAPALGGAVLAGWYPHGDAGTCNIVFNGAQYPGGTAPTLADVFTVEYDNFNFYWYRNNALILQEAYPSAGPLYLFGDFYSAGPSFVNINIAPFSPSTPQAWIARGTVSVSDTSASKTANDASWTSGDAYSINGYQTCHLVFKANQTTAALAVGLVNGGPPTASNYTGLTFALYCDGAGNLDCFNSGAFVASLGTYATSDFLSITYDGATVRYSKNNVVLYTQAASGCTLFADAVLNGVGGVNSLEWGPGTALPLIDTGQIQINAITQSLIASGAINLAEIASGTITSTLLGNGTVLTTNIGTGQVWQSNIKGGAVTTTELGPGAVQPLNIGGSAVTTVAIAPLNITTGLIAPGAVTNLGTGATGQYTFPTGNSTGVTLTITTTGGPCLVFSGMGGAAISWLMLRDGIQLYSNDDLPAAGVHTYSLTFNNTTGSSVTVPAQSIVVMEMKK